jgi:predicted DsbA family dithiol-disulfide isomerase
MMAGVSIVEFTDPVCPWAWSAEPHRLKLDWTYGDALAWEARMVGLSSDPSESAKRFTPEQLGKGLALIAAKHGMPIYEGAPERMQASFPACRAVVSARLNDEPRSRPLLRELRKRCFSRELIDEPAVIDSAAEAVGIAAGVLADWLADDATEDAFRADMDAARHPSPAGLAVKRKLAEWEDGWRYTCPSYVLGQGDESLTAPGFQPYETYETAIANLAPDLEVRSPAETVTEALEWAEERGEGSLATAEVAAICGLEIDRAHDELAEIAATERKVGKSAFWEMPG